MIVQTRIGPNRIKPNRIDLNGRNLNSVFVIRIILDRLVPSHPGLNLKAPGATILRHLTCFRGTSRLRFFKQNNYFTAFGNHTSGI